MNVTTVKGEVTGMRNGFCRTHTQASQFLVRCQGEGEEEGKEIV